MGMKYTPMGLDEIIRCKNNGPLGRVVRSERMEELKQSYQA